VHVYSLRFQSERPGPAPLPGSWSRPGHRAGRSWLSLRDRSGQPAGPTLELVKASGRGSLVLARRVLEFKNLFVRSTGEIIAEFLMHVRVSEKHSYPFNNGHCLAYSKWLGLLSEPVHLETRRTHLSRTLPATGIVDSTQFSGGKMT